MAIRVHLVILCCVMMWATVAAAEPVAGNPKNMNLGDGGFRPAGTPLVIITPAQEGVPSPADEIPADTQNEVLPTAATPLTADIDEDVPSQTHEQRQAALDRKINRLEAELYHLQNPAPGETFVDADNRIKKLESTIRKLNRVAAEKQEIK